MESALFPAFAVLAHCLPKGFRCKEDQDNMERILVSMNCRSGSWDAWSRAISLARRIRRKLYALLVLPPSAIGARHRGA